MGNLAVASSKEGFDKDNDLWHLIKSGLDLDSEELNENLSDFQTKSALILNQKMIASLAGFPSVANTLTNLDFSFNNISSLAGLRPEFEKLEIFLVSSNKLENLDGFPQAPVLQLFSAKNNILSSLKGMPESLPRLETLLLDNNNLTSLNEISLEMDSLSFLSLRNNEKLKDISGLLNSLGRRKKLYDDVYLVVDLRETIVPESEKAKLRKFGVTIRD